MSEESLDVRRLNRYGADTPSYVLAIITDEDKASQVTLEDGQVAWRSMLRYDRMYRREDPATGRPAYTFEEVPEAAGGRHQLVSLIAEGGRGAEFSELVQFGNKLLAFDDRTGLVCEIRDEHQLIPRQILITGSGDEVFKGFKAEWATLKGDELVVGSHGKVGGSGGALATGPEEWVKFIDSHYRIRSVNWHDRYQTMREAMGIDAAKGYLTHEAAEWHPFRERWYFFPRKVSREPFDEDLDERERGGHSLIVADADFRDIEIRTVGERVPERGVSSIKAIPGHPEEFVALKSVECGEVTETFAFCFDLDGRTLSDEIYLGAYKCEGVEIV